jgi:glycosyltransferase involved in cell wall biosynthesis
MVTKVFPPRYAGATIQAVYLAQELRRQGVGCDFVTDNHNEKTVLHHHDGLPIYKLRTFIDCLRFSKIREIIYFLRVFLFVLKRKNEYSVIFIHSVSGLDCFLFPLLKLIRQKTILELTLVASDDPLTLKKRKLGFLFYPAIRQCDKVVAISTRLKEMSLEAGLNESRVTLIPVGVDISKFRSVSLQEKKVLKEKLGYSKHSHVFLAAGQVEERKGYHFMLQAWAEIVERFPDAALLIAGPKNEPAYPYFLKLANYIQEHHLDSVQFLGFVENVNEYMKIADCLIHCATSEGLPNILLEAGSSGIPIVCRKIPGVTSDIIFSSNIGRECETESAEEFASHVAAILSERDKAKSQGEIEILRKRFDIKQVARQYVELFESV